MRAPSLLALLFALEFALAGGAALAEAAPSVETVEIEEAETRGELPTAWGAAFGDLDAIKKRGVLRALVVPGPITYFVDHGQQHGAIYEALVALEHELNAGRPKGVPPFRVAIVPTSPGALISDLVQGRGDLAAGLLSVIPAGARVMDYSTRIAESGGRMAVTGADEPTLTSPEALAGREVWLRPRSGALIQVDALNRRLRAQELVPMRIEVAPPVVTDQDLLEMVDAGIVPMTFVHPYQVTTYSQALQRLKAHPATALVEREDLAWGMRKGSPKLKAAIDRFMVKHRVGTRIGNVLLERYVTNAKGLSNPRSAAERRKYQQMVQVFRNYSTQYDMDHLLMLAQGYQESQLEQSRRSSAGAIGVMQLLPSTGAQMAVGDITKLGPNVHAGVKYMRWLLDEHFNDPAIAKVDKVLLGFAAYNAGPSRIQQMRREAKRRGLDPNRWFGQVELVTAQRVGREPVTYVANIYKYYLAYTLVVTEEQRRAEAEPRPR